MYQLNTDMKVILILLCFVCFTQVLSKSVAKSRQVRQVNEPSCGYQSCHEWKEGHINVHLIPHSHDDVGWVKTVDQFYYGTNSGVYAAGVAFIYDSVLPAVKKNKDRRFIYVETAFFWKWWQEQSEEVQNTLRELVDNGQIEFIGGGWSMNDEAVTNYQSIIDQMTWGLRRLNDTFGECGRPKMGWQIDPFGHSNEMGSIFAQLGYDGVILGRIDYEDKSNRLENKSMEMVWRGSENAGRKSDIFTSVLFNHYDAPQDFCFDILCTDENLVDDQSSPEYNIEGKATNFIAHVKSAETSFQTSNIIVPMGRDFAYQQADRWYSNMDKLIKYINKIETFNGTKYNLIYSTPSCYTAAVQQESAGLLSSPLKTDDFMPYASDPGAFWTGYYTSRPTLKRFERMGNNFLQVCKQLYAISNLSSINEPKLNSLRQAMGVLQHHDAITGTEKEIVAYDYARLLHLGISDCENVTSQALSSLINADGLVEFDTCLLTNMSQCALTEKSDRFLVTVYNPLSRPIDKYVRLPVNGTSYEVIGPDGKSISTQLIPISLAVQKIPGRESQATVELIFKANQVPPLGFISYYIQRKAEGNDVTQESLEMKFKFKNTKGLGFTLDHSTGLLASIESNDVSLPVDQRFWFYNGSNGFSDFRYKASGAYIFRPDEDSPIAKISDTATFEVYEGNIVTEVHQKFNEYVKQNIRIYETEKYVEFDWIVGPIIMDDTMNGKEIISRFTTDLKSDSTFYTDSNGRDMIKRVRNYRPTWDLTTNETASSNYYPITSRITLKDEKNNLQFAVLTDRAEGGSSLEDGEIELMLLRNTITDDQLGVGESLMELAFGENIAARGSHYVTWGHTNKTYETEETIASIQHEIALQKLLDSWVFLSVPIETSFNDYNNSHVMQFSGLVNALPKNIHIMTLEPWTEKTYLLRLEHVFEKNEDPLLSGSVTVNLKDLFSTFQINSIKETTLGGNQWLKDNQRLNFKSLYQSDDLDFQKFKNSDKYLENLDVILEPMEIRTFIIEVINNNVNFKDIIL